VFRENIYAQNFIYVLLVKILSSHYFLRALKVNATLIIAGQGGLVNKNAETV
jgi:hypothetical protein